VPFGDLQFASVETEKAVTALAAAIIGLGLNVPFTLDLQYATSAIANRIYAPIPLLVVAACWYLVMTSVLMIGQHFLEQYFGRGFNGRSSSKRLRRQAAIQAAGTTYKNIALEVEQ